MPNVVGKVNAFHEYRAAEFSVVSGCDESKRWRMAEDDRFVVGIIQAAPLSGEPTLTDLRATELIIEVDQMPLWRATADLVTVLDAGAQAQIDELRSMLMHLMNMAPPPTTNPSDDIKQAMRLSEAMRRLGWSPVTQDHRVPTRPIVVGPRRDIEVRLVAGQIQRDFVMRVILRGIRQQTELL